jgi:hypothetical protein
MSRDVYLVGSVPMVNASEVFAKVVGALIVPTPAERHRLPSLGAAGRCTAGLVTVSGRDFRLSNAIAVAMSSTALPRPRRITGGSPAGSLRRRSSPSTAACVACSERRPMLSSQTVQREE